MEACNFEIEKASIFDMYEIVKMALFYHKDDPKSQEILSNPLKSFLYKLFGPLYVRSTLASFKATVHGKTAGYILIKRRDSSLHVWDLVVGAEFRGQGIGESLMKSAEKLAESRHRYVTLAVMEDNVPAMRLYEKLGYENFQFSPVCYHLGRIKETRRTSKLVNLEPVSGETSIRSRRVHFSNILDSVIGPDKREIVQLLYPLPSKARKNTEYFTISESGKDAGHVSIKYEENLVLIFLLVDPRIWNTAAEKEAIMKVVERGHERSDRVEVRVIQAYEKSLESILRDENCVTERKPSRLVLIKTLK